VLTKEVEYWRRKLAGRQTLLDLPTASASGHHGWQAQPKNSAWIRRLAKTEALAQAESSDPFMVHGCISVFLSGTPTRKMHSDRNSHRRARNRNEIEKYVGLS